MKAIRTFINSKYFIIFTLLITLVCWFFETQTPTIIYSTLVVILIIISKAPRINIVTIVFAGLINYRNTSYENNVWLLVAAVVVVLPFLIYDLIKQGFKYKNSIFIAMMLYLFVNIISLVNISSENLHYGLVGVSQTAAYCLLFYYLWNTKEKDDFKKIAQIATYLSVAISIQVLIFLLTYEGQVLNKDIVLGWSATNSLAMTYLVLLPMTIYLYVEDQKRLYLILIIVIDFAIILLTFCKGAYLTILILIIPLLIFATKFIKDKKKFGKGILLLAGMMVLFIVVLLSIRSIREGFINYFSRMGERGWFNDQARIGILKYGAEVFKEFPIFGSGSYTAKPYLIAHGYHANLKHYHNYIIQNLATLGIFGLISFGNYIIQIFRKARAHHFYNVSVIFALLAMLIHGMVDNTLHNPIIVLILTIYLTCLVERQEDFN
ncbi:MAG: O-antigen ligase family protein [Bacilli bacterium]|nr:O-antigen ligase family protein [Bacilli bacterium]